MGYGYGLWLIIDDEYIKTKHISHVTLICNMEKKQTRHLYDKINEHFQYTIPDMYLNIERNYVLFDTDMYSDTDNNTMTRQAWGYNCNTDDYNLLMIQQLIKEFVIKNNVNGSIPFTLHITMEYGREVSDIINNMTNYTYEKGKVLCRLKLVNITSENPLEWMIVK